MFQPHAIGSIPERRTRVPQLTLGRLDDESQTIYQAIPLLNDRPRSHERGPLVRPGARWPLAHTDTASQRTDAGPEEQGERPSEAGAGIDRALPECGGG